MGSVWHIQQGDWQLIESSSKPVFVDFWAEWCAPCHMLAPIFEKLAELYGDDFSFAKVNVEELPELANKYGVRAIPTLLLFQEGKVVERLVGVRPQQEFARILEQHSTVSAKK